MLTYASAAEKRPSVFPPTLHPYTSCGTNLHFRARSAPVAAEKKNWEKKNKKIAGALEEEEEEEEQQPQQQQVLLYRS